MFHAWLCHSFSSFHDSRVPRLHSSRHFSLPSYCPLFRAGFKDTQKLEQHSAQIDALHAQNKERLAQLDKALQATKDAMFKHSHDLFTLRKTEANLIAEISGAQGASRNLQSRIRELDGRSLKQQEMLYSIEFQVQQLERKVSHSSGKRSVEDTIALNAKIAELQTTLDQTKAESSMLSGQLRRLQDDLRAAHRTLQDTIAEKEALTGKLAATRLEVETEEREVRKSVGIKEGLVVKHDEMHLEVQRLVDLLESKKTKVLELEQRKLQLELAMKEREKEVALHREVQRAEVKAVEEARHQVVMDLRDRQLKLDRIKAKYETVAGKLRGSDGSGGGADGAGAGGEERTQAYYIIAAAQKREELQREGDGLNESIRRAEKEILMLAKTLKSLQVRNQSFRESFHKADPNGQDMRLKDQLEQKQRHVADGLFKKKVILREIAADFDERRRLLGELINDISTVGRDVQAQDHDLAALRKQLAEQESQLQRAVRVSQARRAEYRKLHQLAKSETTPEELFIMLHETKRANALVLEQLRVFVEEHGELREVVTDCLDEAGVNLDKFVAAGAASRGGAAGGAGGRRGLDSARSEAAGPADAVGGYAPDEAGEGADDGASASAAAAASASAAAVVGGED